jgi:hypothetical protein
MADANGSGTPAPPEDDNPDRVKRSPEVQKVVDRWFSDEPKPDTELSPRGWLLLANNTARRMTKQHQQGKSTTGRRGCLFSTLAPAVAVVLAGWAVR